MEQTNTPTATVTPVVKDIMNGITRPKAGTTCGRVWDICNELSEAAGTPAERAKVIAQATGEGINAATVATQHGKWRKYYGLTSAVSTPEAKAEKEQEKAAAKEKKAADAAAKKEAAAKAKQEKADAKAAAKAAKSVVVVAPATTSDVSVETDEAQ